MIITEINTEKILKEIGRLYTPLSVECQQELIANSKIKTFNKGEIGVQVVAIFCSTITFAICTVFLTVPAYFILYKFFITANLTHTRFEERIKMIF